MTISENLKKHWIYVVFIIIVIIPLMYVVVSFVMMANEPSYRLVIEELNESDDIQSGGYWENGSLIRTSNPAIAIKLTEEDFKTFPKLASIIQDRSQKSRYIGFNGRVTYWVDYWEDEHYTFVSHFGNNEVLEYKGKRYHFMFMNVD